MTKRDRYSVQTDEETAAPFPSAEKIFPGRTPMIPRREDTEALKQQITQLQEQLAMRGSGLAIQDGALVVDGFQFSPTGLIVPDDMTPQTWENVGHLLFRLEGSIQWLIGDWLAYGVNLSYGDMPRIAEHFGRDESTLHTYKQMAENIEFTRRRVDLSFGHHQVVRALPTDQQDEALAYAAERQLSVAEFRRWLRSSSPKEKEATGPNTAAPQWTIEELERWDMGRATPYEKAATLAYVRQQRQRWEALEKKLE